MVKRILLVVIVVAALLVVAAPAMAWNGFRQDYTATAACQTCHSGIAGIPAVYMQWSETGHARAGAHGQGARLPYGSSCAGCHVANYAPAQVIRTPTATATLPAASSATPSPSPTGYSVSWGAANGEATTTQTTGTAASSESFVGCSACHYGANVAGGLEIYGVDPNDTAHAAPNANLANAAICGQCHSRYSYSETTTTVLPVPYVKLDASGSPIPNPSPTTVLQPQYPITGYKMLGAPASWVPAALSTVLNVPSPGWTPMPDPAATTAAGLMHFWQVGGKDSVWQYNGHDGSASQYPEWANEGHANALKVLKPLAAFMDITPCLRCHSADYRIAQEMGDPLPTGATAQYGVTCVGCHAPHDVGATKGAWSDEWTPQLRTGADPNPSSVCVECHNGEIPVDTQASPGTEIHHPMKEMMDGYGAIDVSSFPSVHKGKCVKCHMPPTSTSPTGANHTFKIIMPEVAQEATAPTYPTTSTGLPTVMPYSACTTCHNRPNDPYAVYLQQTIDQRQEWTKAKIVQIKSVLSDAAVALGYADTAAARNALVLVPKNQWTTAQRAFLSGFTNVEFVESEGSFGLHNWDYSREIVNVALLQANVAKTGVVVRLPWVVTLKLSKTTVKANTTVTFSGTVKTSKGVAGTGKVQILKRINGVWTVWKSATLNTAGDYSLKVKLTSKGTFYMRASMDADSLNLAATSNPKIKLVVN